MKLMRLVVLGAASMALLGRPAGLLADGAAAPEFKEVYELIRSHLAGETESDLNQAAVQGLLQQLHAKVALVSGKSEANAQITNGEVLPQTAVYDNAIGYLRIGKVGQGLADQVSSACKGITTTNKISGIILDLRFAGGQDYAEAAAVADLFLAKNKALMDWGNGLVRSKEKANAFTMPVAVLVNQQTAAAAEALAAVLRQSDGGLIIGTNTAGEATAGKDFPLKNGQFLRIATAAVKLGDGETLSANGIKPDIQVAVAPEEERAWFSNPYKEMPSSVKLGSVTSTTTTTGTNGVTRTNRTRMTEADLIRERKERPGLELEYSTAAEAEPEKPTVRDPVLARAMDLIKGISALRQTRS